MYLVDILTKMNLIMICELHEMVRTSDFYGWFEVMTNFTKPKKH